MAGNLQSQNVTFQAAESCVRFAFLPASLGSRQSAALALDRDPNANTNAFSVPCINNMFGAGITATVTFSLPTNPGLMSGYEPGKQYPLAMTGSSTLTSGATSNVQVGILQKGP